MLIGLAGLSGAGKSTAIAHLSAQGFGTGYYAGATLVDELVRRGLPQIPDNERAVRKELRDAHGMAVFAERALPALKARMADGHVLLDAVYCPEERDCYRNAFGENFAILAIAAPFDIRSARLLVRLVRPITSDQLAARDELELGRFDLGSVLEIASHTLYNVGTLNQFEQALDDLRLRLR
jgi:dephospho-CoA kinase